MKHDLIIKVCGMRETENIQELNEISVNWMGMIFYNGSKRYLEKTVQLDEIDKLRKVGVFVDSSIEYIKEKKIAYQLDLVQLHGAETPLFCDQIRELGVEVIKVFSVGQVFDFNECLPYVESVDYFLFDTKGVDPGGNGQLFDWSILKNYKGPIPFLLAGGIGPDHIDVIKSFQHPDWRGIDLNSRFELTPGTKNINQIKNFVHELFS